MSQIAPPQNRGRTRSLKQMCFAWGLLMVAMGCYAVAVLGPKYVRLQDAKQKVLQQQVEIAQLQKQRDWLIRVNQMLRTDAEVLDKAARETFALENMEGENEVIPLGTVLQYDPAAEEGRFAARQEFSESVRTSTSLAERTLSFVGTERTRTAICLVVAACSLILSFLPVFKSTTTGHDQSYRTRQAMESRRSSLLARLGDRLERRYRR